MFQELTNFLIRMILILIFPTADVPPAPDPPLLKGFARNFFSNGPSTAKTSSNVGTNTTQTMSGDCLIGELEKVIEKEKLKEEIVPDENVIFTLPKIPTILDNEDFQKNKK